jgi:hypothetical protein
VLGRVVGAIAFFPDVAHDAASVYGRIARVAGRSVMNDSI